MGAGLQNTNTKPGKVEKRSVFHLWDTVALLKQSHIFSQLSSSALYLLAMKSQEDVRQSGGVIVQEDEKLPSSMFFILEGEAHLCTAKKLTGRGEGGRQTLRQGGPMARWGALGGALWEAEMEIEVRREERRKKRSTATNFNNSKRPSSEAYSHQESNPCPLLDFASLVVAANHRGCRT